ncbi:inositol monophosphatase [Sinorhizobium meliloti]|uniref:inositol monophosphatase family protein n=1 Tax=Rhizobium meliloti TaxID=382 RepID=UPI00307EA0DC
MSRQSFSDDLDGRAELCREVIRSAGALILKGFQGEARQNISMKGPQDFLTEVDEASEAHIREALAAHFPGDGFFGEEGGGAISDRVWVVDPIDGTANFARGIPHFCISIAFVQSGSTEIAAIYNPALDELYFARRGAGATRNGVPIRVAQAGGNDENAYSPNRADGGGRDRSRSRSDFDDGCCSRRVRPRSRDRGGKERKTDHHLRQHRQDRRDGGKFQRQVRVEGDWHEGVGEQPTRNDHP